MKKITLTSQYFETLNYCRIPCNDMDCRDYYSDARGTFNFEITKLSAVPLETDDYYKIGIEMSLLMSENQIPILIINLVYCIEVFVEGCNPSDLFPTLFVEIPTSHIADMQQAISSLTSHSGYEPVYIPKYEDFEFLQIYKDGILEMEGFQSTNNHYLS